LLPFGFSAFVLRVKLEYNVIELTMAYTWAIARTTGSNTARVVILKLIAPDGAIGLGESSPIKRYDESIETVLAFCAKVDASKLSFDDVPGSMKYLDTVAPKQSAAKCAFNIALMDGAARNAGKPIYDLLGLGFRDKQHLTSYTIGIDKPDVIRKKVLAAAQYPVLKLKVGGPDDKLNLGALREVAPTKTVRVDANEGWKTKEEALAMIEWMAKDKHIEFVEQPLHAHTDPKDIAWLKARSPLPLYGDESYHTAKDVELCAQCYHGVNVKLSKTAGISGAYEALKAARKAGLKTMIGCMIETSILISAAAHLAELTDHLDIDGNILCTNDPYLGVTSENGILSFAAAPEKTGLRVSLRS
jgi:L-alanine-DL-glutamate epimerase-like enolase superfamily enzyme